MEEREDIGSLHDMGAARHGDSNSEGDKGVSDDSHDDDDSLDGDNVHESLDGAYTSHLANTQKQKRA